MDLQRFSIVWRMLPENSSISMLHLDFFLRYMCLCDYFKMDQMYVKQTFRQYSINGFGYIETATIRKLMKNLWVRYLLTQLPKRGTFLAYLLSVNWDKIGKEMLLWCEVVDALCLNMECRRESNWIVLNDFLTLYRPITVCWLFLWWMF